MQSIHSLHTQKGVSTLSQSYGQLRRIFRRSLLRQQEWSVETDFSHRFPFIDKFHVGDNQLQSDKVIQILQQFISEDRKQKINRVIDNRTFNLVPVVEGVFDMGNLAAVCRSAEALGCGQVYCVTNRDSYKQSARTSAGAEKWLAVKFFKDTDKCLMQAKSLGYRVLAAALTPRSVPIWDVDWTIPSAVLLGNEKKGLSEAALQMADMHITIPMTGFVESFNISVAASLVLYEAQKQRIQALGKNGDLDDEQKRILRAVMYLQQKIETASYIRNILMRPPAPFQKKKAKFWEKFKGLEQIR